MAMAPCGDVECDCQWIWEVKRGERGMRYYLREIAQKREVSEIDHAKDQFVEFPLTNDLLQKRCKVFVTLSRADLVPFSTCLSLY